MLRIEVAVLTIFMFWFKTSTTSTVFFHIVFNVLFGCSWLKVGSVDLIGCLNDGMHTISATLGVPYSILNAQLFCPNFKRHEHIKNCSSSLVKLPIVSLSCQSRLYRVVFLSLLPTVMCCLSQTLLIGQGKLYDNVYASNLSKKFHSIVMWRKFQRLTD